jgi:membrane protein insertase, YidC/Oxa1 family, C-terminal domain
MNSKGSSIVGFALIGIILLLFSWYNTKQFEKQQAERQHVQDSLAQIALEEGLADDAALDSTTADAAREAVESGLDSGMVMYQSAALEQAYRAETVYSTLENDKLRITVSSLGAQPYEVLVKDYFTYDSLGLYLVRPDKSRLNFELNAEQWVNTEELNFSVVSSTPESLVMRLYFTDTAYLEAQYVLPQGSYMVDYNLHFVGMNEVLARRTTQVSMNWEMDVPRFEKGYKNERNYSAVAYRNAGENGDVKTIGQRKDSSKETFSSRLRWVGFQQQFFSAIMVADDDFSAGQMSNAFYPENNPDRDLMHSAADMTMDIDARNADFTIPLHIYFGPNHFPTLKSYDQKFEKIIPLGGKVIGTISRYIIIPTFNWLSKSIKSYGLIILILTLMIKLVISPLTFKSYASSAKMKVLKPEIDKISAKYPRQEDAMKKQQATMELYKKAGVSTFGGCLPVLLQFPILWAMFRFFPASIELRQQHFLWADDLSGYDSILDFGFNIPLFGDHFSLFAFLMAVTMFFYSKMSMQGQDTSAMPGMKFMNVWLMPLMMWFLCNNFSAGLSYYYMLSNLLTIGQNWAIRKWFVDEDKIYAKLKEKTAKAEPPKKSKFQQRLEAIQKAQEEQMRQQNKKR